MHGRESSPTSKAEPPSRESSGAWWRICCACSSWIPRDDGLVAADLAARTMTRVRLDRRAGSKPRSSGVALPSGRAVSAADCEDCGPRRRRQPRSCCRDPGHSVPSSGPTSRRPTTVIRPRSRSTRSSSPTGLQAIAVYRLAHVLHAEGVPIVPRVMSEYAHSVPASTSIRGRASAALFSTMGPGSVIGETCEIGDQVTIYRGVTLGRSTSPVMRGPGHQGNETPSRHRERRHHLLGATIWAGADRRGAPWWRQRLAHQSVPRDPHVASTPQLMHVDQPVPDYQI